MTFQIHGHLTLQSLAHYALGICVVGRQAFSERRKVIQRQKNKWRSLRGERVWAREESEAFLWNSHFVQIKKVGFAGRERESFMGERGWIIWGGCEGRGGSDIPQDEVGHCSPSPMKRAFRSHWWTESRRESVRVRGFRGVQVRFRGGGSALFSNPIEKPSEGRSGSGAERKKSKWNVTTGKCHW